MRNFSAIFLLACAGLAHGQSKWIHMKSPDFDAYSSASESDTRNALKNFERAHEFFLTKMPHAAQNPLPVYVVMFGSQKEYVQYRFNEVAAAYYQPAADRDYIVMGREGDPLRIATHEYFHLVARHEGWNLPVWLNEGCAELYSTLTVQGNNIMLGVVIPERLAALQTEKWVPLATILGANHDSPYYNEKNKAGSFYNESWAMTHMLQLSQLYAPKFGEFIGAVNKGVDSIAALEKTYGKPLATIEKDLQLYVRADDYPWVRYPAKLTSSIDALKGAAAPSFDVKLLLADLVSGPNKAADAKQRFLDLTKEDSKRPEPWASLGYIAWREGKQDEAVDDFGKAFERGDRSEKLLWDYGRMAAGSHTDDSIKALTALHEQVPDRWDVRVAIADAQLRAKHPERALEILPLADVDPAYAGQLFYLRATAQIQTGDMAAALDSANNLAKYAKTPEDTARASQLKLFLDRGVVHKEPLTFHTRGDDSPAEPLDSDTVPVLVRTPLPPVVHEVPPPAPSVSGSFTEFVCPTKDGDTPRIVMTTEAGKKTFVIPDPNKLIVVGKPGGKTELLCGPQKATPIKIEYSPSTQSGVDGAITALYFQ